MGKLYSLKVEISNVILDFVPLDQNERGFAMQRTESSAPCGV